MNNIIYIYYIYTIYIYTSILPPLTASITLLSSDSHCGGSCGGGWVFGWLVWRGSDRVEK